jgi:hypothetical protein
VDLAPQEVVYVEDVRCGKYPPVICVEKGEPISVLPNCRHKCSEFQAEIEACGAESPPLDPMKYVDEARRRDEYLEKHLSKKENTNGAG